MAFNVRDATLTMPLVVILPTVGAGYPTSVAPAVKTKVCAVMLPRVTAFGEAMNALPVVFNVNGDALSTNGLASVPMLPLPAITRVFVLINVPGAADNVPPLSVSVSVPPKGD